MSFSKITKAEILTKSIENNCCKFSSLCAIINSIGQFSIDKSGISFSVTTDNIDLINKTIELIKDCYGKELVIEYLTSKTVGKTKYFEYEVPTNIGNEILKDLGIIFLNEKNSLEFNTSVDHHLLLDDCCKKSYLAYTFLCNGTISIPEEDIVESKSRGYHFEIEISNNNIAKLVSNLMGEFGFFARKIERNEKYLVYLKESEAIADFLAFMGASNSCLKLQNEIITRDLKNNLNRQSNCLNANMDKAISASLTQISSITLIEDTIGLDSLPKDYLEIALLRKNYPDASLSELVALYDNKISKSGMSYKLGRLVEISKNL